MSRCFPFPPPGYAGTCSSNEALILSIKPQRENEKTNSDRVREKVKSSDRKKEKKEKKKEKKRKREEKVKHAVDSEKQKLIDKIHQADKYKAVDAEDKCILRREESQLLEKSSVTEEHGRPVDSQNASCSSDSTGNSGKRRRHMSYPSGSGIQTHGNIIRICLSSSQKTDKPSTSGRSEQECRLPSQSQEGASTLFSKVRPCSSNLVRKESALKQKDVMVQAPAQLSHIASTSTASIQLATRQVKEVLSLPDKRIETVPPKEKLSSNEKKIFKEELQSKNQLPPKKKLSSQEKKMLKKELQYKNLFDSWVPPLMLSEPVVDEGDDEWLFGKKGDEKSAKRMETRDSENSSDNYQSCASAVMQPRAHFLPDADMYALPFTLPF